MRPDLITIHCSATPDGERCDIGTIKDWHLKRGFTTVGYHAVIQPDGEVQHGRPLSMVGAHVQSHNVGNIGICLVGNTKYTKAQFKSLKYYLDGLRVCYQIKPWMIRCHYEFDSARSQGKSCPNMYIGEILMWYLLKREEAISRYLLD